MNYDHYLSALYYVVQIKYENSVTDHFLLEDLKQTW